MSEEELLRLLRERDNRGFRYLYTNFFRMCRKPMFESRIPEEYHREIFHESVIVLYENLQKGYYEHKAKISSYLYQVCKFKSMHKARQIIKEFGKYVPDYFYPNDSEEENKNLLLPVGMLDKGFEEDDWQELPSEDDIIEAIKGLGEPCHDIITGFYYHQASIKNIMQRHGYKSENAAKQAKFKCTQRLKSMLLKQYHDQRRKQNGNH